MHILIGLAFILLSLSTNAGTKIFFLFGPSQSGKSTWINTVGNLQGNARAAVGSPCARTSTTSDPRAYEITNAALFNGEKFVVIDVPGLWDNRLALSNDDIKRAIKEAVLRSTGGDYSLSGIIAFESLAGNLINFLAYIPALEEIFGSDFLPSTLLLLTKGDKLSSAAYEKSVFEEAAKKGLNAMRWDTLIVNERSGSKKLELLDPTHMAEQLKNFNQMVGELAPYHGAGLQEMQQNIEKRAHEIYINQKMETVTTNVTVLEQKVVPIVSIEESQSIAQFIDVEREVQIGTRIEKKVVEGKTWDGTLGRVFGVKKICSREIDVEVPVMTTVKERKLVNEGLKAQEAAFRTETVSRQQALSSQVAPWSMDYCRELARQELLATIHAKHY